MAQKQKAAVIALFRIICNQDDIILHKDLQNDILSVLDGILDNLDLPQTSQ